MASDAELSAGSDEPALRITADVFGSHVAMIEDDRVVVLALPDLELVSELGLAGASADHDVAFVGDSGRIVVLDRHAPQSVLHVVDPTGPHKVGEVKFAGPTRIVAVAGPHVLATGSNATTIVDVTRPVLAAVPVPLRGTITAAGRTGPRRFVVAVGGAIEEWDGDTRKPGWRLRVDRPLDPAHLGGNAKKIWLVPRGALDQVALITLASRTTRHVELPEPVAHIDAHPEGEVLAVVGAHTSSVYVVHISGEPLVVRLDKGPVQHAVWIGRGHTLLVKPRGQPLELVTVGVAASQGEPAEAPAAPRRATTAREGAAKEAGEAPVTQWSRDDISRRMAAWRGRFQGSGPAPSAPPDAAVPGDPQAGLHVDVRLAHPGGWRAEVAAWARAVRAGSRRDPPAHDLGVLDDVVRRLGLARDLGHALAMVYGAYLGGIDGVPVIELAAATGWSWPEAVGTGQLAATGALRWRRGRVTLVAEVLAALDDRPPLRGDAIPAPGASPGEPADVIVAIVAPSEIAPSRIATWAAPTIGALLVPNARGERKPRRFLLEARVRGLSPLVPWERFAPRVGQPPLPSAIVVANVDAAASLALPVVATWSEPPHD